MISSTCLGTKTASKTLSFVEVEDSFRDHMFGLGNFGGSTRYSQTTATTATRIRIARAAFQKTKNGLLKYFITFNRDQKVSFGWRKRCG